MPCRGSKLQRGLNTAINLIEKEQGRGSVAVNALLEQLQRQKNTKSVKSYATHSNLVEREALESDLQAFRSRGST